MSGAKTFGKIGVFVMGDMGRSPRMLNHAIELAQNPENAVELVGQLTSDLPLSITSEPIRVRTVTSAYLGRLKRLPGVLYLFLRILVEALVLFYHFFFQIRPRYDYVLVQNPPGIPVVAVLFFYSLVFRAKIWVDVHNYGYTLYQTRNRALLALLKFAEVAAIRLTAHRVFVVSEAMRVQLRRDWGVRTATVLYDMPNRRVFGPFALAEKHAFLLRFAEFTVARDESVVARSDPKLGAVETPGRPLLLVVSSSWSHDDDFETLVAAVRAYEASPKTSRRLVFVLTGSGPAKAHYSAVFGALGLSKATFVVLWFEARDYPRLVASCDYGVSLHSSTSGVDLPIKALDYMACEVPCLAFEYTPTIRELVVDRKNGLLFRTAAELAGHLEFVAARHGSLKWDFPRGDWTAEWRSKVF